MGVDHWQDTLLGEGATIGEAIATLDRAGLQIALLAKPDRVLIGTITDGDIRRGLLKGLSLDHPVTEIVNLDPLVVPQGLADEAVLSIMSANKIHQLPIVDADRAVCGLHIWDDFQERRQRPNLMVIMAGGKGTRLRPYTEDCPKPMLPIAGKPMLEHLIERAKSAGISRFLVSLHYLGHQIEEYFGDGSRLGVSIEYLKETSPLGTGGALSLIRSRPTEPLLVTNGDVVTAVSYGEILDYHELHGAIATMAVRSHEVRNEFGVVLTDGLEIVGFEEKPIIRSNVNAGIYVLDSSALDCLGQGEHCDMPTLFERLRKNGQRTVVFPLHEDWLDVGRPDDLERVREASSRE